jgi:hypothetical protein
MKRMYALLALAASALALEVAPIRVSAELTFRLFPELVVVERVPEPAGIVVVYQGSRAEAVFRFHDQDLRARGWQRVRYEVKKNEWKAEYRKGRAKASLSVKDKKGRIEVRLKED